jgi:glyoxylase-like metal-dependent hydrolase (beta-lactamase superfamily II)
MTNRPPAWYEPGIFEVAPGIHRIPLPLPDDALRAVNVYAIVDGESIVLIDAGWVLDESRRQLVSALKTLGCGLGDISEILVTHVHADHYSQAVALRQSVGSRISLGEGERATVDYLSQKDGRAEFGPLSLLKRCGAADLYAQLRPGILEKSGSITDWGLPDTWLGGVDIPLRSRTLRAIATPGHTQGHVVFLDAAAGLLFAGDHVLPHITPSIGFEGVTAPFPLRDYLFSLQLIRSMPDARLLPAHGPTKEGLHDRVDELLEHHRTRLAQSLAAIEHGASTARDVARELRWTRHERHLDELDPFNQMLAVLEASAHLEVLVDRQILQRGSDGDTVVYSS